jgi:hypothetical protein
MYEYFAQAVGFVAAAMLILSFQCKSSRKLFFVQMCANAIYVIHFLMLGAYSGCVSLFISCVRNLILSGKRPWCWWKGWPWLLIAANLAATAATWQGAFSILPCIAVVSVNFSAWSRNGKKIRMTNIFSVAPSWLIYSIYTGSVSGVITELITLGSVAVSVMRYGWKALDNTD